MILSRETISEVQVQPLKLQSIFVLFLSIKDSFISIKALVKFSFDIFFINKGKFWEIYLLTKSPYIPCPSHIPIKKFSSLSKNLWLFG